MLLSDNTVSQARKASPVMTVSTPGSASALLVDFIRDTAELTGTHVGCAAEGRCGACTVLLDGVAVKSCLMLAVQADGADILTVEGLASDGKLHPIQEAFWEHHGLQCGYCTPGMLMALCDFMKNPSREEEDIRTAMSGVLCPCTGYVHIVDSMRGQNCWRI